MLWELNVPTDRASLPPFLHFSGILASYPISINSHNYFTVKTFSPVKTAQGPTSNLGHGSLCLLPALRHIAGLSIAVYVWKSRNYWASFRKASGCLGGRQVFGVCQLLAESWRFRNDVERITNRGGRQTIVPNPRSFQKIFLAHCLPSPCARHPPSISQP